MWQPLWTPIVACCVLVVCLMENSFRDIAGGHGGGSPSLSGRTLPTPVTPSPLPLRAGPLGNVDLNAAPSTSSTPAEWNRFAQSRLRRTLRSVVTSAAKKYRVTVEEAARVGHEGVASATSEGAAVIDGERDGPVPRRDQKKIILAIREMWALVNEGAIVSSKDGYTLRRIILGIIANPDVGFQAAKRFLGGFLKRTSFKDAQARRSEVRAGSPPMESLCGTRKKRSDTLENMCPLALDLIATSIDEHTQPSPCATKKLHVFSKGNHRRSEEDNSLICVHPDLCKTEPVRYMLGTAGHLYGKCMEDLSAAHQQGLVEVPFISRAAWNQRVPFNVVEQSLRSCLCVHCHKAKLITVALCQLWPILHAKGSDGKCGCTCDLCKHGGCDSFLPFANPKAVNGMGLLSDKLLCAKEFLYMGADGKSVEAHKSACVSGFCPDCKEKQERFFKCPLHKGDASRRFAASSSSLPTHGDPVGGQPGMVQWKMFTTVDENGRPVVPRSGRRGDTTADDAGDDEEWVPSQGRRTKQAVVSKRGTVSDFFSEFQAILCRYFPHRRQYKSQRRTYNEILANLEDGTVLLVADFQEQLAMTEQDEVQSQHWMHESVTIFPCPFFFKWEGRVWSYSFQVISNDTTQDSVWVQHVMSKLLGEYVPAFLKKVGAEPMTTTIVFTDNCAKQFKCRYSFNYVSDSGIMVRDAAGRVTGRRLHLEWHYYGSCHGKNSSDSEGSVTKSTHKTNVINQTWAPTCPREVFVLCERDLGFLYVKPTLDEEEEFYATKRDNRGSQQVLLTKVFQGQDGTQERKTQLVTKRTNTLLGRKYIYVPSGAITAQDRQSAKSERNAIPVPGCHGISRTAMSGTPGVIRTFTLSCCCEPCRQGTPEMCVQIRRGIIGPPAEWSRTRRDGEERSAKEEDTLDMFERMHKYLPFGSIALMRVHADENAGRDIVPVVIGRKAPCDYSPSFAADGLFGRGDIMVWIHDIDEAPAGEEGFDLPRALPCDETRAVPLKCIAGLGQGSEGYLEEVLDHSDNDTTRFRLRPGAVADARSNLVLMSTNPSVAFENFQPVCLSDADEDRAFVQPSLFEVGHVFRKGFKAPSSGRHREWSGSKFLEATVIDIATSIRERRHYYMLEWEADERIRILAHLPEEVDEGYVEFGL